MTQEQANYQDIIRQYNDNDPEKRRSILMLLLEESPKQDLIPFLQEILLKDDDWSCRTLAIDVMIKIGQEQNAGEIARFFISLLEKTNTAYLPLDGHYDLFFGLINGLGELGHPSALPMLAKILTSDVDNEWTAGLHDEALKNIRKIYDKSAVEYFVAILRDGTRDTTRSGIAEEFGNRNLSSAAGILSKALATEKSSNVRRDIAFAIVGIDSAKWEQKIDLIIEEFQQSNQIPDESVIVAMAGAHPEMKNAYPQIDYLLGKVQGQSDVGIKIISRVLLELIQNDAARVGERINSFQEKKKIPIDDPDFQQLRINTGGKEALDPVLQVLQKNFTDYFQKPTHNLNEKTKTMWHRTFIFAQIGFVVRILMSSGIFIIGVWLVIVSGRQFLSGDLALDQLVGPGVSFVSGLATIFLITYSGPLKEIRQSVSDLGNASTAFIAYTHRVLQVSHTFSLKYLRGQIDFDELKKSSRLIEDAMRDTFVLLKVENGKSVDEILKEIIKNKPKDGA